MRKGSQLRARLALCVALAFCAAATAAAQKKPPAAPLDLNSASAAQLATLPGVGASTAHAIVQFREKSGPFRRVEDLRAIQGISAAKLEKIRPYVMVIPPKAAQP
jgi:competence protein ComEA